MKKPALPDNENERVSTLHSLDILDTPAEERFDRITRMAKRLFNVPIAIVSLVDSNRQWFKSCVGLEASETPRDISFCGHAILGDQCFIIPDAQLDERFHDNPLVTQEPYIRFYAGCPIKYSNGHHLGTLCIIDTKPRTMDQDDMEALRDLSETVERELVATQLATIDSLTLLNNKRGFLHLAEKELAICSRHQIDSSLVYFDLDKFKSINDQHGHAKGDLALKIFSQAIIQNCRTSDIPGRLSGDEFVLLLPDTNETEAKKVISRIRRTLKEEIQKNHILFNIGFSYGICEFSSDQTPDIDTMLLKADTCMYKMKSQHHLDDFGSENEQTPKILIIDDDPVYRSALSEYIFVSFPKAQLEGFNLNKFSLGEPYEDLNYSEFDLIFLDYHFDGDKTGLNWFVGQSQHRQLPPTVLISGRIQDKVKQDALNYGLMDFFAKKDLSAVRIKLCIEQAIKIHEFNFERTQPVTPISEEILDIAEINTQHVGALFTQEQIQAGHAKINQYQIIKLISHKSYADVYQAYDHNQQCNVALKVFRFKSNTSEREIGDFLEQGVMASSIRHPNLIKTYEYAYTGDFACIAMEMLSNKTLSQLSFPLGLDAVISYSAQIALGINQLHAVGIVHRHLKPDNLFINDNNQIVVSDFGIAKDLSNTDESQQLLEDNSHSAIYTSPEEILGNPITQFSDLYSLGVIMYRMAVGNLPFHSDNISELKSMHVTNTPAELPKEMSDIGDLVLQLLKKKPTQRGMSAYKLYQELLTILNCRRHSN